MVEAMDLFPEMNDSDVQSLAQYEHSAVKRVISKIKVGEAELMAYQQEALSSVMEDNDGLLTFRMLSEFGFPIQLHAIKMRQRQFEEFDRDLEMRPLRTPIFAEMEVRREDFKQGEISYQGIVFPWKGRGRYHVLHDFRMSELGKTLRLWKLHGVYYYLETLDHLVERLGPRNEW